MIGSQRRVFKGIPVCPGLASGRLIPVTWPETGRDSLRDIIAFVPDLRTDLVILLTQCVGIVARTGGALSHGAILVRELNIPCAIIDIPKKIADERTAVLLDGGRGTLEMC